MKRRILTMALAAAMVLSLAACGGKPGNASTSNPGGSSANGSSSSQPGGSSSTQKVAIFAEKQNMVPPFLQNRNRWRERGRFGERQEKPFLSPKTSTHYKDFTMKPGKLYGVASAPATLGT